MSNSGILTGEISSDSPKLFGLVRRTFNRSDAERISEAYRCSFERGGCTEFFPREEGVSFNPKAARVGCLLLQEGGLTYSDLVCVGLLGCVSLSRLTDQALIHKFGEIALSAQEVSIKSKNFKVSLLPLYVSHDIDILRHVHMMRETVKEISTLIEEIRGRKKIYETNLSHIPGSLFPIFTSTLERTDRTL